MISAAVFDMDGTLFDTEHLSTEGWIKAGKEMSAPLTADFVARFRGTSPSYSRALCKEAFGEDFDYEEAAAIRTAYVNDQIAMYGVPVKKGAEELLSYLAAQGIPCAVATSTVRANAERYLKESGLSPYFSFFIYGDMVKKSKPDPEIFLTAAKGLGVPADACAVFEDSPNGIAAGIAAGCAVFVVPDVTELTPDMTKNAACVLPDLAAAIPFLGKLSETK